MDFHQLNLFIEVARQKNFTRAAEKLFLSQPTVSTHIKKLEEEVGTPLLMRKEKGLELTEAGKTLFRYAQELLETRSEALAEIQSAQCITAGHLIIAASSVPGAYFLPDLLHAFRQEHPDVTFTLQLHDTEQVLRCIKDYTCDLGFTGEFHPEDELSRVLIVEDELIVISAPDLALAGTRSDGPALPDISLEDCTEHPFLMRESGSATRMVFEEALKTRRDAGGQLNVIGDLGSQEAVKQAVKSGLGIAVITRRAVEDELRTGLLAGYRLQGLPMQREFYTVFRKKSILSQPCKRFFDFTCDYYAGRQG